VVVQGVRCLVLLGLAGGLDDPLDQPRRQLPTVRDEPVQLGVDLAGALGEAADQLLSYPLELAVAVSVRRCPLDPECPDEFPLVGGPVDGVRSQPMPIQIPAVQGRPAAVRPLHPVGDDQMGVQQRIALARCPVVEADRQQPLSGHVLDTAVATAGPKVSVQVADRLDQPGMMGRQYGPAGGWVTEAVEDRDALGRPQHHIKARHGVAAMGPAQQLPGGGIPALEHGLEPGHGCFACQPQAVGAGAIPAAWLSPWPDRYCWWSVASSRV
jgi:hypothetical protein